MGNGKVCFFLPWIFVQIPIFSSLAVIASPAFSTPASLQGLPLGLSLGLSLSVTWCLVQEPMRAWSEVIVKMPVKVFWVLSDLSMMLLIDLATSLASARCIGNLLK